MNEADIVTIPRKEGPVSIAEIMPAVQSLSRSEKFQLAHILLGDLAREEPIVFREGHVYPIHTPQFGPDAATQLAKVLAEEGKRE